MVHTSQQIIAGLRKEEELTLWFFEVMGPALSGKAKWDKEHRSTSWSKFITVSCEAYGLLLLENNENVWRVMAGNKSKAEGDKDMVPAPLYTQGKMGGGRNAGWNEAGQMRFQELMKLVKERRSQDKVEQERIEKKAMEQWKERGGGVKKGQPKEDSDCYIANQIAMIDVDAFAEL